LGGDLGTLGADFVKLDAAPNYLTFKLTEVIISSDFAKIGGDMGTVGGEFGQLGDDLVALGTGPNTNSGELNNAWKVLGDEFHKISTAFDTVAVDFQKLSQDFATLGVWGRRDQYVGAGCFVFIRRTAAEWTDRFGPLEAGARFRIAEPGARGKRPGPPEGVRRPG
jgi:hypothetical protein